MDKLKTTSTTLSPSDQVEFKQGDEVNVEDGRQFAIVPTRAICDPRISPMGLRVLAGYCMYARKSYGQHRMTLVGQRRVAREIGVSQASVSNYVRLMRELGYMKKGKRPRYKLGRAQTHLIFYGKPVKNGGPGNVDDIIDQVMAHHNPSDDAPPVPVSGFEHNSMIQTDRLVA